MGIDFSLGRCKSFGDRRWGLFHNNVNALYAAELVKMVMMVMFILYIFYHNKKKRESTCVPCSAIWVHLLALNCCNYLWSLTHTLL